MFWKNRKFQWTQRSSCLLGFNIFNFFFQNQDSWNTASFSSFPLPFCILRSYKNCLVMLVAITINSPPPPSKIVLAKVMLDTMAFIFIQYSFSKGILFSEDSLDNDDEIVVFKKFLILSRLRHGNTALRM